MEAFSSLKFWRDSGGGGGSDFHNNVDVRNRAPEEKESYDEDYDDESFFDLVFTNASNTVINCREEESVAIDSKSEKYLTIESPFKPTTGGGGEFNGKHQSPITFLNAIVPKFRVPFLGFKKSKSARTSPVNGALAANQRHQLHESHGSVLSNNFAVEEVQISSLFSRDNSFSSSKLQRECNSDYFPSSRKSPKDFPKYLKLIKPLYVRASKRYFERPRISSDLSSSEYSPCSSPATAVSSSPTKSTEKRSTGFRVLTKHLRKSRSVSSPASRRDDSLFLQNDGIQSAILHCKQSLNNTSLKNIQHQANGRWPE